MSRASSQCASKWPPKNMVNTATSPTSPPATITVASKHQLMARLGRGPEHAHASPSFIAHLSARVRKE